MDNLEQKEQESASKQQHQQQQQQSSVIQLPAIEATIIDIPASVDDEETNDDSTAAIMCTNTISNSMPSSLYAASNSSAYDTDDCSTASSTCCTQQGEHIYMQRCIMPAHQSKVSSNSSAAQHNEEALGYYKADRRKSWPFFMLAISLIEVSC